MKKFEDGRIVRNSTPEHLMQEKARSALKRSGISELKTIYMDDFSCIMEGKYSTTDENDREYYKLIKIYILMRNTISDKVSMNLGYYRIEEAQNGNPLLILSDLRHLYPIKFLFFEDIGYREYGRGVTPIVLFPEDDFEEIKYLNLGNECI